jgi:hypothetical protein
LTIASPPQLKLLLMHLRLSLLAGMLFFTFSPVCFAPQPPYAALLPLHLAPSGATIAPAATAEPHLIMLMPYFVIAAMPL